MMIKVILLAVLAVGVFCAPDYKFDDEDVRRFQGAIRATCKKNGAEDKADHAATSFATFVDCVRAVGNLNTVKKEIDEAKPNNAYSAVFKKYCVKTPELKSCMRALYDGVYPCLDAKVRDQVETDKTATDHIFDYICENDAEKISAFFSQGGNSCFDEKDGFIGECVNKAREGIDADEEMKNISIDAFCNRLVPFSTCSTTLLKECASPVPSQFLETLNNYLIHNSPCKKI